MSDIRPVQYVRVIIQCPHRRKTCRFDLQKYRLRFQVQIVMSLNASTYRYLPTCWFILFFIFIFFSIHFLSHSFITTPGIQFKGHGFGPQLGRSRSLPLKENCPIFVTRVQKTSGICRTQMNIGQDTWVEVICWRYIAELLLKSRIIQHEHITYLSS